jgi:uncharacterized protein YbbC (DUF1343 family)
MPEYMITRRLSLAFLLIFSVSTVQAQEPRVMPGVDVLLKGYSHLLKGKRVALLTNQTGKTAAGVTTIDALHQHPDISLQVLFSPEHGIRGKVEAGEHIGDSVDRRTGIPIVSLYGKNGHRPPADWMRRLDIVIYDIQDVGSRAYTYIWSMAKAMEASAEFGTTLMVLDRPNPLGGGAADGPVMEDKWRSFIGMYAIPRTYGMTCGELARYFNHEERVRCNLVVIPMAGYTRAMTWHHTGLKWTAPSPNIPNVESAMCFPATGTIGTLGQLDIGIGTNVAFQIVGAPWLDARAMADHLTRCRLPGVTFEAISFVAKKGGNKGKTVNAVKLNVTSPHQFRPSTTEVLMLNYLHRLYPSKVYFQKEKVNMFDKANGTSDIRIGLQASKSSTSIINRWAPGLDDFHKRRRPYLIYE